MEAEDLVSKLRKELADEKRARENLEAELELNSRMVDLYIESKDKIVDSVGVSIIQLSSAGQVIKLNQYAVDTLFEGDRKYLADILSFLRLENSMVSIDDLSTLVDKDFEIVFMDFTGQRHRMGARVTKLHRERADSELLLTMKDMEEIFKKDEAIKELQHQLVDSAYRDGVAENAVSVLHNIGNILTTINGKMSNEAMLEDLSLLTSVLEKMAGIVGNFQSPEEFSEFVLKDPRAKSLPHLLKELAKSASTTEKTLIETFSSVKSKCNDIAEVIAAQQNYANFKDKSKSRVSVRKIVTDCLTMHKDRLANRTIEVIHEDFCLENIFIEKIGLAQTLNNAFSNAIEAIDERFKNDGSYSRKWISVSAVREGDFVVIKITDNGAGIKPETLSKLFKFGFSTKNRSSGFGLHNCANFMIANGGQIKLLSSGVNQGASTLLFCPIYNQEDELGTTENHRT